MQRKGWFCKYKICQTVGTWNDFQTEHLSKEPLKCYFKLSSYKILSNDLFESDYNVTQNANLDIMRPFIQ